MTEAEKIALNKVIDVVQKLVAWDMHLGIQNQTPMLSTLHEAQVLLNPKLKPHGKKHPMEDISRTSKKKVSR